MIRSAKFWILMAVFQVVFGLTVFTITRQYYSHDADKVGTSQAQTQTSMPEWPVKSAESDLEELISSYPGPYSGNDPAAISRQADELFNRQQYDEAAVLYRQLLSAGSKNVNTYNNLGITLHYLGRSTDALRVLNEGVALDPSYPRIWLTLGFVNSQLGNIGQARSALTKAVQLGADSDVGQSATKMLNTLGSE